MRAGMDSIRSACHPPNFQFLGAFLVHKFQKFGARTLLTQFQCSGADLVPWRVSGVCFWILKKIRNKWKLWGSWKYAKFSSWRVPGALARFPCIDFLVTFSVHLRFFVLSAFFVLWRVPGALTHFPCLDAFLWTLDQYICPFLCSGWKFVLTHFSCLCAFLVPWRKTRFLTHSPCFTSHLKNEIVQTPNLH